MSEGVGSVGEEAVRLLRALGSESASAARDASDQDGPHSCPTSWCPVCQVADFVRENPEVIAGVVSSAGSLLGSLRDLLDAAVPPKESS